MAQPERYDILVLGSGTAGKLVAWQTATAGRRTAVVERKWIGGSCPNIACMPSKNEISSARVAHLVRHAAEYGWTLQPGAIDMAVVRKRKRDMVAAQVAKHLENYKASGAELIMGSGRFVAPKTIEVWLNDGRIHVLTGRRGYRPSDHGRGARFPSRQRASSQRATGYPTNLDGITNSRC